MIRVNKFIDYLIGENYKKLADIHAQISGHFMLYEFVNVMDILPTANGTDTILVPFTWLIRETVVIENK